MDIKQILKQNKNLSEKSINHHFSNVNDILYFNKKEINFLYTNPHEVENYLKTNYNNPLTFKTKLASVVCLLKCMDSTGDIVRAIFIYNHIINGLLFFIKNSYQNIKIY
jgi:hypothetical protein